MPTAVGELIKIQGYIHPRNFLNKFNKLEQAINSPTAVGELTYILANELKTLKFSTFKSNLLNTTSNTITELKVNCTGRTAYYHSN